MLIVPTSSIPSQSFQIVLDNQDCDIELLTRGERLYLTLAVDGEIVQANALCLNRVSIIQIPNSKFYGTLAFVDTLGSSNPEYSQLGDRYQLFYWYDGEDNAPINHNPATDE